MQDLSRLLLISFEKATLPKGESKSGLVLCGYGKRVYPKEEEYPLFNEIVVGRFFSCRKVFLNFGENRLTNFFLGI